jgi:hypothetical protein
LGPNDQALQNKRMAGPNRLPLFFGTSKLFKFQKYGQLECWTPDANGVFPCFPKTVLQAALYSTMPPATVHFVPFLLILTDPPTSWPTPHFSYTSRAASEFLLNAAIQFKLGRAPPSESLTNSKSVAQVFGHHV